MRCGRLALRGGGGTRCDCNGYFVHGADSSIAFFGSARGGAGMAIEEDSFADCAWKICGKQIYGADSANFSPDGSPISKLLALTTKLQVSSRVGRAPLPVAARLCVLDRITGFAG